MILYSSLSLVKMRSALFMHLADAYRNGFGKLRSRTKTHDLEETASSVWVEASRMPSTSGVEDERNESNRVEVGANRSYIGNIGDKVDDRQ